MTRRHVLVAWLALALVCAQVLGLMHRVVHPASLRAAHLVVAAHEADAAHSPHAGGWVADLFTAHDDDSGCRLFDGVQGDAAPSVASLALPLSLPAALLPWLAGECLARRAALYDARGPPPPR